MEFIISVIISVILGGSSKFGWCFVSYYYSLVKFLVGDLEFIGDLFLVLYLGKSRNLSLDYY